MSLEGIRGSIEWRWIPRDRIIQSCESAFFSQRPQLRWMRIKMEANFWRSVFPLDWEDIAKNHLMVSIFDQENLKSVICLTFFQSQSWKFIEIVPISADKETFPAKLTAREFGWLGVSRELFILEIGGFHFGGDGFFRYTYPFLWQ